MCQVLILRHCFSKVRGGYISHKLFPRKTRHATVKLECFAVKWELDIMKYYLHGGELTIETLQLAVARAHKRVQLLLHTLVLSSAAVPVLWQRVQRRREM